MPSYVLGLDLKVDFLKSLCFFLYPTWCFSVPHSSSNNLPKNYFDGKLAKEKPYPRLLGLLKIV